mgnify:CR=1 FL=1
MKPLDRVSSIALDLRAILASFSRNSLYHSLREIYDVYRDPGLLKELFAYRSGLRRVSATNARVLGRHFKNLRYGEGHALRAFLSDITASIERDLGEIDKYEDKLNVLLAGGLFVPPITLIMAVFRSEFFLLAMLLHALAPLLAVLGLNSLTSTKMRSLIAELVFFLTASYTVIAVYFAYGMQESLAIMIVMIVVLRRMLKESVIATLSNTFNYYKEVASNVLNTLQSGGNLYKVLHAVSETKGSEEATALRAIYFKRNGLPVPLRGIAFPYVYNVCSRSLRRAKRNILCFLASVYALSKVIEKFKARLSALTLRISVVSVSIIASVGILLALIREPNPLPPSSVIASCMIMLRQTADTKRLTTLYLLLTATFVVSHAATTAVFNHLR